MLAFLGSLLLIIPLWRISARAGFAPHLAIIAIVPFIGLLAVAAVLAFGHWPAHGRSLVERED